MISKTVTVTTEGVTLPSIVWQVLKRQPIGYVEAVFKANPGLCELPDELPTGTVVVFPIDAIPVGEPQQHLVRLWD